VYELLSRTHVSIGVDTGWSGQEGREGRSSRPTIKRIKGSEEGVAIQPGIACSSLYFCADWCRTCLESDRDVMDDLRSTK
jgi:hypothetical protein